MATESAPATGRPRPWLLVALGLAIALFVVVKLWTSPAPPPTVPPRQTPAAAGKAAANGTVDPADLTVRLESLQETRPDPGEVDRNPFRFYQPPPPMPVAPPQSFKPKPVAPEDAGPPPPPPPPPIPLKFIGIVESAGVGKVAAFSDCKRTFYGREGDIVDGRYKLLKIGVESVTMVYPDGRGQQVIRLSGEGCVGK